MLQNVTSTSDPKSGMLIVDELMRANDTSMTGTESRISELLWYSLDDSLEKYKAYTHHSFCLSNQVIAVIFRAVGLSPTEYEKCFEAAVKTLHKHNLFETESFTKWSGYRSIKPFADEAREAHGNQPTDTVGPPYLVMSATVMISTIAVVCFRKPPLCLRSYCAALIYLLLDKKIRVDINNSTASVPEQMDNGTWLVPSRVVKHRPFFDEIDEFFSSYSSEPDADGDSMESEADDDLSEPEPDSDDNHPEPDNSIPPLDDDGDTTMGGQFVVADPEPVLVLNGLLAAFRSLLISSMVKPYINHRMMAVGPIGRAHKFLSDMFAFPAQGEKGVVLRATSCTLSSTSRYQKLTNPDAYEMIRTEHDDAYRELMDAAVVTVDIVCATPAAFAEFANNSSWGPDLIIIDEATCLSESKSVAIIV
ncbi:hypothetical protein NM208_g10113 [Fusarium decemcellulare]|uniref:Uncharacterized protein n=1 Tax=Fusarium decemcellulare TaxID=57161 RepID=A0ACC1RZ01_9HYPO|nr:hypothetical protein NM208_g10113 [Fusarium decemcellulare]